MKIYLHTRQQIGVPELMQLLVNDGLAHRVRRVKRGELAYNLTERGRADLVSEPEEQVWLAADSSDPRTDPPIECETTRDAGASTVIKWTGRPVQSLD